MDLRGLSTTKTEVTFYLPELYDRKKPAPLLLTLHGSGDDGRLDYRRWQSVADTLGMVIVSPTDKLGMKGFSMSAKERESMWQALRWARRTFNIDECRMYGTGISRGGHLLWDAALRQPDRFALLAPMIGGPLVSLQRGRNNIRYVENLVDVVVRDLQGSKDDAILVENLRLTFERLKALGAKDAQLIEFPKMGHSFEFGAVKWTRLLLETRRNPVPDRVIRRSARKGEGRAHWVEILDFKKPTDEVFQLRVDPGKWRALSPADQRTVVVEQAEARTARVEARRLPDGQISLETKGVKKLRLLLTTEMLPASGPLLFSVNGKTRKKKLKLDKRVLLREFAERFDRTFLPVAEVVVKP
jgi:acetyl esterase/lipase